MVASRGKRPMGMTKDAKGNVPFLEYLNSETDTSVRALILSKVELVSGIDPSDYDRPLVDTLDGRIKELRCDKQVRVLFSAENDGSVLLFYGGERKKNGSVSQGLVDDAKELRDACRNGRQAVPLKPDALRAQMRRSKIKWPKN